MKKWKKEVDYGIFPDKKENSFEIDDNEFEKFLKKIS